MTVFTLHTATRKVKGCLAPVKEALQQFSKANDTIFLTESTLRPFFSGIIAECPVIELEGGETSKTQETADKVIDELIRLNADKSTTLIGLGGGMVTDMAGYVASVYKRGMRLGLVPASLLAMVDASIGGKNGINKGLYKNVVGTIYQPEFIIFDTGLLATLPQHEWKNGFSEIIKHAVIADGQMFEWLEEKNLEFFVNDRAALEQLVWRNVMIKSDIVGRDELDTGERKRLNFGHTIGHAIENLYGFPHGQAVSIGMVKESVISEKAKGLSSHVTERIKNLITKYGLPVHHDFRTQDIWSLICSDKKRNGNSIDLIMLDAIGSSKVESVEMDIFSAYLNGAVT